VTGRPAGAASYVPGRGGLADLRSAAAGCRGCDLWEQATQTVFGEGPADAEFVAVGEQPGDQEDRQGHPFVGPAGRMLHDVLEQAGIDPARVYLTNIVKHFRWEARGKRRIHKTPARWQVVACQPWFAAELGALTPRVLIVLGATAGTAVLGSGFRVTRDRGTVLDGPNGLPTIATLHPAAVLRAPPDRREREVGGLVADLAVARRPAPGDPCPP
jgi:uracil-DNA glycosylase family protein